jgi:hypothetical protein
MGRGRFSVSAATLVVRTHGVDEMSGSPASLVERIVVLPEELRLIAI